MPITVSCDCGRLYPVRDDLAGQRVECPDCGALLTVPGAAPRSARPSVGSDLDSSCGTAVPWIILGVLLALVGVVGLWYVVSPATPKPPPEQTAAAPDPPPPEPTPEPVPEPPPPEPMPKPEGPPTVERPPGEHVQALSGQATIYAVAVTADGKHVLSAGGGTVRKDGGTVAAEDTAVHIRDAAAEKDERVLKHFPNGIGAAAFSPDGRYAALAGAGSVVEGNFNSGADFDIHVWDLDKDREARTLKGHTAPVFCLAFSPDGRRLVSGGPDRTVRLWDPLAGTLLHTFSGHTHTVNSIAVSPDGRLALSGGGDRGVYLWDLDRKKEVRQFTGHKGIVWAVAFSPDGKLALSGGGNDYDPQKSGYLPGARDFDLRLWEVDTGKERQRFHGHTDAVSAVAFSPDGRRILSGGFDKTVRLWQTANGRELRRYDGSGGVVNAVAFLPGGRLAISGGEDRALRVWYLPPDVPDLVKRLQQKDADAREDAIRELGRYGPEARTAVVPLLHLLADADSATRRLILATLPRLGPPPPEDTALLGPLLKPTASDEAREYALDMLAALGPSARVVLPALAEALKEPRRRLRRKALLAVAAVGPEAAPLVYDDLIDALRDPISDVHDAAALALAKMGPPTPALVPGLRKLLKDRAVPVRRYAATTLARLGPDAAAAASDLIDRLEREEQPAVRLLVVEALLKVRGDRKATAAALVRALADGPPEVSVAAVNGLAQLGPDATTFPVLIDALGNGDRAVARAADDALQRLRPDRAHARPLGEALARVREPLRPRLLELIARLGPDGADAVPGVVALLKDATGETRLRAVQALGAIGPAARDAGPLLAALLTEGDRRLSLEAALALAKVGPEKEAAKAIALLVSRLRVEDTQDAAAFRERETARKALLALGRPAVAGLIAGLEGEFSPGDPRAAAYASRTEARMLVITMLDQLGAKMNLPEAELALAQLEGRDPVAEVRKAARNVRDKLQDRRTKSMLEAKPDR